MRVHVTISVSDYPDGSRTHRTASFELDETNTAYLKQRTELRLRKELNNLVPGGTNGK